MIGDFVDHISHAESLLEAFFVELPSRVDGREAILQMMSEGGRHWRQMEWIGFWFEHLGDTKVGPSLAPPATRGPRYGNTEFDIRWHEVWDCKAHPKQAGNWAILNDAEAIDLACAQFGGVGFVVLDGVADYDLDGSFKAWHDSLKGGVSDYERLRVKENRPSRRRKTAFTPSGLRAIYLDPDALEEGRRAGWIKGFQEGMRNADGRPRRSKVQINLAGCDPAQIASIECTSRG